MGATETTIAKAVATKSIAISELDTHSKRITQALAILSMLEEKILEVAGEGAAFHAADLFNAAECIWAAKDLIAQAKV